MNTSRPARRPLFRTRAALVAAVLVLCACGARVDMHTGLTDSEANQVVAALRDDGIKATKLAGKGGVTVSVPETDLARANAVLTAQGLPHKTAASMGEVFKKEGLVSSPLEERARYVYALSQELETTIGKIDGVVVARVHVVLPEKVGPGEPVQPPSAAVFVKHLPTLEPDAVSYRIRQLVARSIPGMGERAVDRVSAVFIKADVLPERAPPPPDRTVLWISLLALLFVAAAASGFFFARQRGWLGAARRPREARPAPATPTAGTAGTTTTTA